MSVDSQGPSRNKRAHEHRGYRNGGRERGGSARRFLNSQRTEEKSEKVTVCKKIGCLRGDSRDEKEKCESAYLDCLRKKARGSTQSRKD